MFKFLNKISTLLDHEAKKRLPLLLVMFVISSLLDVFGLGLIGIFLLLIVSPSELLKKIPANWQSLVSHFTPNQLIAYLGIIVIAVFIIKMLLGISLQKKIMRFSSAYNVRLKHKLLHLYQSVDYLFHITHGSVALINRVSQVDEFTRRVFGPLLNVCANLLIVVGVLLCLLFLHPVVTLFLVAMFGLIFLGHELLLKQKLRAHGVTLSRQGAKVAKNVSHALGGFKEIRVLGKENYFLDQLKYTSKEYAHALASSVAYEQMPRYMIEAVAAVFLVCIMLVSLWIDGSPLLVIPTAGVFAVACMRLLPTINQAIVGLNQIRTAGGSVDVLIEEFSSLKTSDFQHIAKNQHEKLPFEELCLKNICFQYPQGNHYALDNINFLIRRGQSIGLMGASGSGKSTLVNLILGLLHPQSGEILVDGQSIKNRQAWLNNFAYIPQHIFLLDDTLRRNIAMGVEDDQIDEERLARAVAMAQLTDVITRLPQGMDTVVGENGLTLSGGQRQRVALARAFYHERDIIVMDEATSALDTDTEKEIVTAIKQLHGLKTLIVIAHRLTTIEHCDAVFELKHGKVINFISSVS